MRSLLEAQAALLEEVRAAIHSMRAADRPEEVEPDLPEAIPADQAEELEPAVVAGGAAEGEEPPWMAEMAVSPDTITAVQPEWPRAPEDTQPPETPSRPWVEYSRE